MKKNGFTLMEVLVALAIIGASSVVFLRYVGGYLQLQSAERRQAQAYVKAVQTMEFLIREKPSCQDSGRFLSQDSVRYVLSPLPGQVPLLLAEVESPAVHNVRFRRLVLCETKTQN